MADALVLPSFEEGLPIAVLEALSCGVPVVTTPVGSIGEVLTHGTTCLFVKPGDSDGLAFMLQTLAVNPNLRKKLGENGRRHYRDNFTSAIYMSRLLGLYEKARRISSSPHRFV